ncbi:MAG: hypothetical protein WBM57_11465 [Woeseiaceae bacterium]
MTPTRFWRRIFSIFKIGLAVVAIGTPVLALWDTNDPWPVSNEARIALEKEYAFVPVGGSWRGGERLAQTALLFPKTISAPKFVAIRSSDSEVTVQTDQLGFWLTLLYLVAGWYLAYSYARKLLLGEDVPQAESESTILSDR